MRRHEADIERPRFVIRCGSARFQPFASGGRILAVVEIVVRNAWADLVEHAPRLRQVREGFLDGAPDRTDALFQMHRLMLLGEAGRRIRIFVVQLSNRSDPVAGLDQPLSPPGYFTVVAVRVVPTASFMHRPASGEACPGWHADRTGRVRRFEPRAPLG